MWRPGGPGDTHSHMLFPSTLSFPCEAAENTVFLHLCATINLLPGARNKQMRCEMRCPNGLGPCLLEAGLFIKAGLLLLLRRRIPNLLPLLSADLLQARRGSGGEGLLPQLRGLGDPSEHPCHVWNTMLCQKSSKNSNCRGAV